MANDAQTNTIGNTAFFSRKRTAMLMPAAMHIIKVAQAEPLSGPPFHLLAFKATAILTTLATVPHDA